MYPVVVNEKLTQQFISNLKETQYFEDLGVGSRIREGDANANWIQLVQQRGHLRPSLNPMSVSVGEKAVLPFICRQTARF